MYTLVEFHNSIVLLLTQLFHASVIVLLKSHALKLKLPWLDFIVASLINSVGLDLLYL